MSDSHDFPVDLPADPDGGASALHWTASVLTLTTLALAPLNASAIANWSHELAPSPRTAKLMAAADAWQGATARVGLDAPHAKLHGLWKRAQSARWSAPYAPDQRQLSSATTGK